MPRAAPTDPVTLAVERRILSGDTFTYSDLCAVVVREGGNETKDRTADRTVQRLRKRGLISFFRQRGSKAPIWTLTEEGHNLKSAVDNLLGLKEAVYGR